jgi:tetratricopeptide (TPR) repeat protein
MQIYFKTPFYKLIFVIVIGVCCLSCNRENNHNNAPKDNPSEPIIVSDVKTVSAKIETDPENPELYYQRSVIYFRDSYFELALADINDAIKYDSLMPLYWYLKGRITYASNRTVESEKSYKRAIELNADYEEAKLKLAEIYLIVKEHQKSIDLLNNIVSKNKKNADAYFFRGMNQKEVGDTGRAISSFQLSLEADPDYYDANIQLGIILTARKNNDATKYLDAATKMRPKSKEAWFAKAYFFQEMGNFQQALNCYRKVIEIEPENVDAYYNVGIINMDAKQYKEALRSFDICVKMNPDFIEAYYMRGQVHEKLENTDDAKLNYEYIIRSGANFPEAELALKKLK